MTHHLRNALDVILQIGIDGNHSIGPVAGSHHSQAVMERVRKCHVGVQVRVQTHVPLDIGQNAQVVVAALIPVTADIGLREVKRTVERVYPVMNLHRSLSYGDYHRRRNHSLLYL